MADTAQPHYHAFLSHNSRDKGSVEPLAVELREKGLNPFLDKWNLVPGEPIEDALIEALENSDSAVIFLGPGGEGPWQSEEMRDILKRAVKSRNEFRAIPVLLPDGSAEALERSFLGSRLWIEFTSVDDDDALLRLAKAIQGEAYGDETFKLPDEPAPYRGLERFERIEKPEEDFFFGRDDEVRALVERLVKDRFVAVVGASGSGKSSLIRAGLTKQLADEVHPGIRRWKTITMEPGSAPFRSLAVQIAVAAGIPVAEREDWIEKSVEKWRVSPDGVRSSLEVLFADAKEPILLFVDQFEECFTHCPEGKEGEAVSKNFVASLTDIWRAGDDRIRVVIALRADFVERCLEIAPLKELLQDRTMLVGEVGDDALREIVKEPAARVGAFLEKGLMERILVEVHDQSGSLPLLQQALHELWKNRKGAWLTHEAYDASGGVAHALNDQAQSAYKALNDVQKQVADGVFLRLITLGEGVADTRRRVRRKELYPEGVEPAVVDEVIEKLSGKDARILVTTREGGTVEDLGSAEDFVEFTHEALLANWEHLVTLLNSERDSIRQHRNLTTAAETWDSKPEDEKEKFLLRHGQLEITEQWVTHQGGDARLNQVERRFLEDSICERNAEEARKAKTARRLKWLSIGATAAAIIAFAVGGYAFYLQNRADAELRNALLTQSRFLADLARQETKKGDPVTAMLLALEAIPDAHSDDQLQRGRPYAPHAESSLDGGYRAKRETILLLGHEGPVYSVAVTPDGGRIVTGSYDKTARIWDAKTGAEIAVLEGHEGRVNSVVVTPDGARIVTGSQDNTARIWDVKTGTEIAVLEGHEGPVYSVPVTPDGARIITGSFDKTARIWDAKTGAQIAALEGHKGGVWSVAMTPDGALIVTGSQDGTLRSWDAKTGAEIAVLLRNEGLINGVAVTPDGARIVTDSRDNTARIWDAKTGAEIAALKGHEDRVQSVAVTPDGTRIVTGSRDNTARIWDAKTGAEIAVLKGHKGIVYSVAVTPDGSRIVTGSQDKTARIWDVKTGAEVAVLEDHEGRVQSVAVTPDGTRIVTGSRDKTARIWDAKTGAEIAVLEGHDGMVVSVAVTPDGARVVTGSSDKTARIWDAKRAVEIAVLEGHEKRVTSLAVTPDGARIVTGSRDRTVRLWEPRSGLGSGAEDWHTVTVLEDLERAVESVAMTPDGSRIVFGSQDRTARIWDAKTGAEIVVLKGHRGIVYSVAVTPDGSRIVTGSQDKTARIWDVKTGAKIVALEGHMGEVWSVAVTPDGARVVTGSRDKTVRIWDVKTGIEIAVLEGHEAEVRSVAVMPDGMRIVTGSWDKTARIWSYFPTTQELVDNAKAAVPRCLTKSQRNKFFLSPEPPRWCFTMKKWPYHETASK